jgi:transcriptional regulator with XRE-family HTH domain
MLPVGASAPAGNGKPKHESEVTAGSRLRVCICLAPDRTFVVEAWRSEPVGSNVLREIDGTASPLAFFGAELRRFRAEAGLSQEQLGQRIGYSGTMIGKIETGERATSERIAERCDEALATKGLLIRIYDLARRWDSGSPSWFAGWKDRECTATAICWWEPSLVPGLVQNADYARAILRVGLHPAEDELEDMVSARMERQAIFGRPNPPTLWVIIDEAVLHRRIGNATIMHGQLTRLAELAVQPAITIQVVPYTVGAHVGLLGGFAVATGNGADTGYMESPDQGQTTEQPSAVTKLTQTFNILRGEALSRETSCDLIIKVAEEQWT